MDIEPLLAQVRVPTLVVHARDDAVVPVSEGRLLAGGIPGAEFVELDSRNHILLEAEPAWARFKDAVLEFTRAGQGGGAAVFDSLSAREREVLALMGDGLSNARHRRAARDQREDGPQPRVERIRQARRVVAGAGDCLCAGPRVSLKGTRTFTNMKVRVPFKFRRL